MYTKIMFVHHLSITRFVVEFLEFHLAIVWLLNHLNHVTKYQKQDIFHYLKDYGGKIYGGPPEEKEKKQSEITYYSLLFFFCDRLMTWTSCGKQILVLQRPSLILTLIYFYVMNHLIEGFFVCVYVYTCTYYKYGKKILSLMYISI